MAQIVLLNNEESKSLLGGQILSNTALAVSGLLALIMNELLRNHGAITSGTITIFWALNSAAFWFYFTTGNVPWTLIGPQISITKNFLVFVATEYYNPPESNPDDDVIIDYGKSESNIEENTFIIYCVQASIARDSLSGVVLVFLSTPVRWISIRESLKSNNQFSCLIYSRKTSRRIPWWIIWDSNLLDKFNDLLVANRADLDRIQKSNKRR